MRAAVRSFGPLAWRDRLIDEQRAKLAAQRAKLEEQRAKLSEQQERLEGEAELRARVAELEADLDRQKRQLGEVRERTCEPSFAVKHYAALRANQLDKQHGARSPALALNGKDEGYRFARSHGVQTPALITRYDDPRKIDWASLPDKFVVKAIKGTNGVGVFALVRDGDKYIDVLRRQALSRSPQALVDLMSGRIERRQMSPELVIEELIPSAYGDGRPVALDCKVYCFYGVVGMIMMRDATSMRGATGVHARYLDQDGSSLGDVMSHVTIDESLPGPLHLDELVSAASRMSAAVPVPFVRLDFYERTDGIVFGEVTPAPGGSQYPRADVDHKLGVLWEDAEARLRAKQS